MVVFSKNYVQFERKELRIVLSSFVTMPKKLVQQSECKKAGGSRREVKQVSTAIKASEVRSMTLLGVGGLGSHAYTNKNISLNISRRSAIRNVDIERTSEIYTRRRKRV